MEFLEQSKSFQKSLIKKSRLFTAIMLASGVGLVAAAPFLSYEAATIQCYEKIENVIVVNVTDTVVMKSQLARDEDSIDDLRKQIRDLQEGTDCGDLLEDLAEEKEILLDKLNEFEQELNDCLNKDDGTIGLKDKINDLKDEMTKLQNENDDLKEELENCGLDSNDGNKRLGDLQSKIKAYDSEVERLKLSLEECLAGGESNNSNLEAIAQEYEAKIKDLNEKIALLRKRLKKCERENKKPATNSNVLNLEFKLYNNQDFSFNKESFFLQQIEDDGEGISCELLHNGNISLAEYGPKTGPYLFTSSGNQYVLKIVAKSYQYYSLTINSFNGDSK